MDVSGIREKKYSSFHSMNTSCCQESNKQKKTCRFHSLVSFLPQKIWMFQDLEDKIIQAFIP